MANKALVSVCAGVVVLAGCGSAQQGVSEDVSATKDKASGVITKQFDALDSAKKDVAAAVDKENKKITEALEVMEQEDVIKNNDKKMMDTQGSDVPAEIDMSLAQTCAGATVTTNNGVVEVELYGEKAPTAVANFCTLAQKGFYDGVIFHRVIKDFMIQGGDPDGIGTGGPGYKFEDELPAQGEYKIGSLAMANAGPNTNGSQFFIVSGANGVSLPPLYTLFGQVTEGLETVEKIQNVETLPGDKPVEDVIIEGIELKMK